MKLKELINRWIKTDRLNDMELGAKIRAWFWMNEKDE